MDVKWIKSMSVGEEIIDAQHQNLLNQINIIRQLTSSQDINIGLIRESIHFLYLYILNHLKYEEEYMLKHKYPAFIKHQKIHKIFIKSYEDIKIELRDKSPSKFFSSDDLRELMIKIEKFLAGWWINHILKEDHKYAVYIKSHPKRV